MAQNCILSAVNIQKIKSFCDSAQKMKRVNFESLAQRTKTSVNPTFFSDVKRLDLRENITI